MELTTDVLNTSCNGIYSFTDNTYSSPFASVCVKKEKTARNAQKKFTMLKEVNAKDSK